MTISIQYVKMPHSETMTEYTIGKLQKLAKKYEWLIKATVHFKKDKDPAGIDKICEIELSAPGPRIFATSKEKNFEMAVKETLSDLEKQLKKRKSTFAPYS
ncbi:HPF/RaiA family ribosome-associated protein [Aureisphaera galaxeae]|uniref:HPF/RaiA family ribosome-associated protein n=1 Tax=Aureisphaera galaxeae TaxID=1538023 RepID=UPI00234FE58F|nr:HPF/RaiA family ribosome-associated protein [Aureisphaera galaxeae]MDC8003764.1 HPF/RaiA family ribosome-associated protein [Aureisphaera galaxeae]